MLAGRRLSLMPCSKRARIGGVGYTRLNATTEASFINTYITSVCKYHKLEETNRCIASLVVPPIDEQEKIMHVIREVYEKVNVDDILGGLLCLLAKHDFEGFNELLNSYVELQMMTSNVSTMVLDALPVLTNIKTA